MIGIFLGEQSSGKTLSMTYFAYKYYKKGYQIHTNYNVSFPHTKITLDLLESYVTGQKQFTKAIFLIDEIYLLMDARNFGKKSNKIFSYFLLQTSKRGVHLFGTAQYFNTVEKRFRENCNFRCFCNRMYKYKGKYINCEDSKRKLSKDIYIQTTFIKKTILEGMIETYDTKQFYLHANPCYELYDTTQLLEIE